MKLAILVLKKSRTKPEAALLDGVVGKDARKDAKEARREEGLRACKDRRLQVLADEAEGKAIQEKRHRANMHVERA